ncbi:hypothetical protein CL619_01260 [archaeon]|nr:hypothetical protein [archaeon]|tara:strand:+ start:3574 stop:4326 length:753 start_codon:yes stop_codon:yes gene_type:complete
MFTLFETPTWFAGFDLVLDTIALIITLIISSYSYKLFKLSSNRKFGYFSLAFALMSLAFLFKLATYTVVYFSTSRALAGATVVAVTGLTGLETVNVSLRDLIYRFGFFVQMASTLGALLLLYLVSQKSRDRLKKFYEVSQITLFTYFVILISIVATFKYTVFYLTSFVLLALIVLNYYQNYLHKKTTNSKRVLTAFICLFLAQLFFVFIFAANWFYFIAEILTLASFAIIAYVYMQVSRKQKPRSVEVKT